MDFVEGLPLSQGKSVIMVVVDRLAKYAHFTALAHPYTAITVAQLFVSQIFKLHGMPTSIVSDKDPVFISSFWKEFFLLQGTSLKMSTSYQPNGHPGYLGLSTSIIPVGMLLSNSVPMKQFMGFLHLGYLPMCQGRHK